MDDEKPGVHYQISITGRQAAAFFLVLLVALALAFFFGMRTGAGGRAGPKPATTAAQAVEVPAPPPAPSAGKSAEDVKPGFGGALRGSEPSRAPSPPAAGEAPKSAPPRPTAPPPVPTAAPAKPTAPPAKATPTPKPAAKKEGPFFVQVLATQKADVADDLNKKLRSDGFPADVTPVPGKAGWFRVRVGPFPDRAKADAAAGKIQKIEKTKHRPIVVP